MIKSLTPLILITFSIWKSNKNEKGKGRLIQNPNYEIPYLPLHTSERTVLIERETLSHLLRLGERKGSHFLGYSGEQISSGDDGVGPVAQRIRARGYEPRCRGFESLLAHNRPKKGRIFPSGGRKIMIGLVDPKLWNLWVVCRNGMALFMFY